MGFTNLYKKTTANPKEIDFVRIGTTAKNKIPDAAIQAFRKKVPGPQAKPFDFTFDYDAATRKMQITVKKVGPDFVFGWADPVLLENLEKMKGAEAEIAGWKEKIEEAIGSAGKLHGAADDIAKWVASVEETSADGNANPEAQKEVDAIDGALAKLEGEKNALHTRAGQFWNSGPNAGVTGLLKKHGISEKVVQERQQADADYRALEQTLARFQDAIQAVELEIVGTRKRNHEVRVKLSAASVTLKDNLRDDVTGWTVEIQKDIGDIQGYTKVDFEEMKAKELMREAKEFASKSGATWEMLSANAGEIDKAIARNREIGLAMRVRSRRVEERCQAWQRPKYQNQAALEKYQGMLKMVRDEYMQRWEMLDKTVQAYSDGLTKYRPKAVEAAAKVVKSQVKADAKVAKAEAKAAKKGK